MLEHMECGCHYTAFSDLGSMTIHLVTCSAHSGKPLSKAQLEESAVLLKLAPSLLREKVKILREYIKRKSNDLIPPRADLTY